MKLTAANLVHAIDALPKGVFYNYINPQTRTKVKITNIIRPEGPILLERHLKNGQIENASISSEMLWRAANALSENTPVNFDRLFGGSYNTRSALEALLAHTPEFYWCQPGRIELIHDSSKIKKGHKHIIWKPAKPHKNGIISKVKDVDAISELPIQSVSYDALIGFDKFSPNELPIEAKRRHTQIQIALIEIGRQIGFRTWIAQNDKGIQYGQKKIGDLDGVIGNLSNEKVLSAYPEAIHAAKLIDCVWFKNGKLMPAVMEVEHSTGIISGLNRMKKFQELGPALRDIRWVIVAPDEDRDSVINKANDPQFSSLDTKYFSYSSVEELHSLCKRRNLNNLAVTEAFLDCFMEPCISH